MNKYVNKKQHLTIKNSMCTPIGSQESWVGFPADHVYNATTCQASNYFRAPFSTISVILLLFREIS